MQGEGFEWDAVKAQRNLAKHRVSFEAACLVFDDLFGLDRFDVGGRAAEVRCALTGMANGVLVTVIYKDRGDRTRIISARKATRHEQRNNIVARRQSDGTLVRVLPDGSSQAT